MRLDSLALVFISAFAHALLSLLVKKSHDKQIFCWLYHLTALFIFLPIPIYYLITEPSVFPPISFLLLASGLLHYGYMFASAKSFESGDISLVYPIIRSFPALVLLGSIVLLGEEVSLLGASGVLLTVFGVYILCMRSLNVILVFTDAFRTTATRFAMLTALLATAYTLVDKVFVSTVPPILYAYLLYAMTTTGLSVQMAYTRTATSILSEARHFVRPILYCAVLEVLGYILVLIAFTGDKVSYVVGLRQISIIIAVLMGGVMLKEENFRQRVLASLVIFLGVLMISFAK